MITNFTKFLAFMAICFLANSINAQEVFWGNNPGEGDFDGGLNGWTVNALQDDSVWIWHPAGTIEGGSLAGQDNTINSATASNGAATFNADVYTFMGGDTDNVPPPYPMYISELISPDIDLSSLAAGTALSLEFNQLIQWFQQADNYTFSSFAVSNDGGMTWSENFDCNEGLIPTNTGTSQGPTNNLKNLSIPLIANIAGSSTVKIKFTIAMNLYYWALDDIKIVKRVGNDIRVQSNFYAIAPNVMTPFSQVENFGFLADVLNVGGNVATNPELQMEIVSGGSAIHNEAIPYPDMIADSLYENVSWGAFTPSAMGDYTGTYTLVSDSVDVNPEDNEISFDFSVTDSIFAKETGATGGTRPVDDSWQPTEDKNWAYGNHYYITNGVGYEMTTAGIVITDGSNATGIDLAVYLYKWNEDTNNDGICDPTERSRVGFNFYTISAANTINNLFSLPMFGILNNEPGVPLEDNTNYVLMVEYADSGDGNVYFLGTSEDYDYGAAVTNSEQQGNPRYAAMLGIAPDLSLEGYSSLGFGRDVVPVVRMHINEIVPVSTNNVLSANNLLEVAPSPATEFININIDLVENQEDALLRVLDAGGKVIDSRVYTELQKEKIKLSVENWPSGSYFLHLTTKDGIKAHHFVVQH